MKHLLVLIIIIIPSWLWSHSGGLNSSGCHSGSKPYHCHRSASEMTKSSSGGNRLKCSSGSQSKDCDSGSAGTSSSKNSMKIDEGLDSSKTISEKAPKTVILDPFGEAATILGFNFDENPELAIGRLENRFKCFTTSMFFSSCDKNNETLFSFDSNALGEITRISFNCILFNGCSYSHTDIYQVLNESISLVGNKIETGDAICDYGVAGEEICIRKETKWLIMSRENFRQKPISFD